MFFTFMVDKLGLSYQDNWPTDYKIAGVGIYRDLDIDIINRSQYSLLDFMSDLGGLNYLIFLSDSSFVAFFAQF